MIVLHEMPSNTVTNQPSVENHPKRLDLYPSRPSHNSAMRPSNAAAERAQKLRPDLVAEPAKVIGGDVELPCWARVGEADAAYVGAATTAGGVSTDTEVEKKASGADETSPPTVSVTWAVSMIVVDGLPS